MTELQAILGSLQTAQEMRIDMPDSDIDEELILAHIERALKILAAPANNHDLC